MTLSPPPGTSSPTPDSAVVAAPPTGNDEVMTPPVMCPVDPVHDTDPTPVTSSPTPNSAAVAADADATDGLGSMQPPAPANLTGRSPQHRIQTAVGQGRQLPSDLWTVPAYPEGTEWPREPPPFFGEALDENELAKLS